MTEEQFLDVAGAILDGTPVSWDTLPEPETEFDRGFLEQLRLLADVTCLHRAAQSPVGTTWGTLRVAERIGSGTFGDVYRASDPALDRDVALKLLRSTTAGRHLAEGRLLARVRHPNVVTVFGAAEHDGVYGIWMEFVRGRTLAQLVAEHGPFPASEVTTIGADVCRALATVHASGLLHGDIKAQNVMREDGGRIVLMDFGTGRIAGDDSRAAALAGTPLYVAPEILSGERADASSDIYSVGVLLYFLLTGAFPVDGRTLAQIREAQASGTRTPVRNRRPDIPRRLAAVIDCATAPLKADRYRTAAGLEAAIDKSTTRPPRRLAAAGALAAAMALVVLTITYPVVRLPPASSRAIAALGDVIRRTTPDARPVSAQPSAAGVTARRLWAGPGADLAGAPSASGRYIPFIDKNTGDLAVRELDTGAERHLTRKRLPFDSPEKASFPVASAKGDRIAYGWLNERDIGELRTIDIDAGDPRVIYGNDDLGSVRPFEWTNDGRSVLVQFQSRHDRQTQLALVSIADKSVRVLKTFASRSPSRASLSPDARYLLYDAPGDPDPRVLHITVMDIDTGLEDVLFDAHSNAFSPIWTSDGRRIVFVSDRTGISSFWAQPMANGHTLGQPELVKSDIGRNLPLGFGAAGSLFYGGGTAMSDVYVATLDVASGEIVSAPALVADRSIGRNGMPDWSPDGQLLAYRTGGTTLSIASADGTTTRRVIPPLAWFLQPRWAPDGRSILAHAQSKDGHEALYTIDAETGSVAAIVDVGPGNGLHATWARDGQAIFYSARADRGERLVMRDLKTGQEREIYRPAAPASIRDLAVSPDNRQVAFWVVDTTAPRSAVLTTAVPATGEHRALVRVRDPDAVYEYAGIAWTADDRLLYVKSRTQPRQHSELWVIPGEGGEPRKCGLNVDGLRNFALHPDGRRIAFTAGIPTGEL